MKKLVSKEPMPLTPTTAGETGPIDLASSVFGQTTTAMNNKKEAWLTLPRKCFRKSVAVVLHSSLVRVFGDGDSGCGGSVSAVQLMSWFVPSIQKPPN
ncbi:hypothetical protein EYF80_014935 [Liparis tanakae]|uniref:Uncharacterized protein n=1 Tax=Liparis tanakae TaxID=230148 RepID=A0A4Z2IBK8_9TELE|nr:hypothetical protein EYF80_014935 [Liparis tanakae]